MVDRSGGGGTSGGDSLAVNGGLFPVDPNPTFQELRHKIDRVDVVDILFVDEVSGIEEKVVTSLSQGEELGYFFKNVEMVPFDRGVVGRCRCRGNPHLKFYSGDQLVDIISVHHGSSIRMLNHYETDIGLKGVSRLYFNEWFKELKVTGYYQREDGTDEVVEVNE